MLGDDRDYEETKGKKEKGRLRERDFARRLWEKMPGKFEARSPDRAQLAQRPWGKSTRGQALEDLTVCWASSAGESPEEKSESDWGELVTEGLKGHCKYLTFTEWNGKLWVLCKWVKWSDLHFKVSFQMLD